MLGRLIIVMFAAGGLIALLATGLFLVLYYLGHVAILALFGLHLYESGLQRLRWEPLALWLAAHVVWSFLFWEIGLTISGLAWVVRYIIAGPNHDHH